MDDDGKGILGDSEATGEQIRQAWEYAALVAMQEHRRTEVPVVTWDWENHRVALIPAEEFPLPEGRSMAGKSAPDEEIR